MSIARIYSDQSRRVDWTVREKTDATLTITVTQNSSAFDLTSYTFIAEFFKIGATTPFLSLTQGSGVTNGTTTGIITLALTDTQLTINPDQYFWKLRTTSPTDYLWFNGQFVVNGYVWDGGSNYSTSVALTVAANNIDLSLVMALESSVSIQTVTSAATVTALSTNDYVDITAQDTGLTIANPSGTATNFHMIVYRIEDDGTPQTIAVGSQFRAMGTTIPTTTVAGKITMLVCVRHTADSKWDVVNVIQQA